MEIKEKIYIHTPMHLVWRGLTRQEEISKWWNIEINLKDGAITWKSADEAIISGRITRMENGKELSFTWKDERWNVETHVSIKLFPEPAGSILMLAHTGWEKFPPEEGKMLMIETHKAWKEALKNLKSFMEGRAMA